MHSSIASSADILTAEILPGRLLHTRVITQSQTWDIINVYQVPWRRGVTEATNLANRRKLWMELSKLFSSLPNRNGLIVGGDFNTVIPPSERVTGQPSSNTGRPEVDAYRFLDIAERHGLVCLNTCCQSSPTFTGSQGDTVIDYMLVQRNQAQGQAKQARILQTPLGQWRGGGKHHPLSAKLVLQTWQRKRVCNPPRTWCEETLTLHYQSTDTSISGVAR